MERSGPLRTLFLIALLPMLVAGGAGAADLRAPKWAGNGSGAFYDEGRPVFFGVGIVQGIKDRSFAAAAADLRACGEVGKIVDAYASFLRGSAAPKSKTASTAGTASVERKLSGLRISGRWRDPADGTEYSLCELGLPARPEVSKADRDKAFGEFADQGAGGGAAPESGPPEAWAGHTEAVRSVALSSDGARALSADSRMIALWELETGGLVWARPAAAAIVAFSTDGKTSAAAGFDGLVHSWDAATGAPIPSQGNDIELKSSSSLSVSSTAPKSEEQTATSAATTTVKGSLSAGGLVLSAEAAASDYMRSTTAVDVTNSKEDQTIALSGSARLGMTAGRTLRRRRWTAKTTIAGDMGSGVERVQWTDDFFSADGKRRFSAGTDGKISFSDPANKSPALSRTVEGLLAAALSANGSLALTGSGAPKDNLILWDAATGKKLASWTFPSAVTAAVFMSDGEMALLGLDSARDNLRLVKLEVKSKVDELIEASGHGKTDLVRALLAEGGDVNAKGGYARMTALMSAAQYGRGDALRALLDKGADVNAKSKDGWTALIFAANSGNADIVRVLLGAGADINARTDSGSSALMIAADKDNPVPALVNDLLDKGADVNAKEDIIGLTALMNAATHGNAEVVRALLAKGANVDAKTKYGRTALSLAVGQNRLVRAIGVDAGYKGNAEAVQLLKDAGASE